ncbi:phage major capsid protein [Cohaesibacter gelatinilyticus]|uniref:Phage major capsid protein, HK97 family n=1 Tax=Cohaesibacter gelatinilyticus TaxID=372072 RepID=A0A285PJ24_9HYPH|nr:phage major capsid protein [Cohaesibacter gelatinilyticus]SNZ21714.1 phage major capsid protein, HK97 family [Cohaesibacter gelatinilyticus]
MTMALNHRARGITGVRADAGNAAEIIAELQKTFQAFKDEHAAELKGIKNKFADVVQTEKVERINNEITELTKAMEETNKVLAALQLGGTGSPEDPAKAEHAKAFDTFFRKGAENGLRDLEVKASLTTQSDPDGGYLVPEEMSSTIDRVVGTVSAMRSLATVLPIGTSTYKKLVNMGGAGSGWVGETSARPETDTPTLRELVFNTMEVYANPAATQTSLDDAQMDIATWLGNEVSIEFAEQEGDAFINGNGVNKPRGVLQYDNVANASYAWGKLGVINTGAAAAFAASDPGDAFIDLYYALKSQYRQGATWLTSDAVMGKIRKFKDGDGNYLWAPPTAAGEVPTILGKPVSTDDNMPALAANALPVAFGNFSRGYLVIDRAGIRVLRDPFSNKPYVHFYTTKRVGGGVQNFEAIKLMKCAA